MLFSKVIFEGGDQGRFEELVPGCTVEGARNVFFEEDLAALPEFLFAVSTEIGERKGGELVERGDLGNRIRAP